MSRVCRQIDLLESKRSYVRYISHELRTPLNTAFLGLKLLSKDLKASRSPRDKERYDTLCDVNMSCTAAVDILNNLLCYEKLESGILELHKENIAVGPFLQECLTMFSVQARECGVALTMVTEDSVMTRDEDEMYCSSDMSTAHLPLQPQDSIYADKFKMDQVIRNLISNALKFTPSGGAVTLKATFVLDQSDATFWGSEESIIEVRPLDRIGAIRSSKTWDCRRFLHSRQRGSVADFTRLKGNRITPQEILFGNLVVVVTDTGAGISRENQGRLFKEIVQFNSEKLQAGGGSGLGLWITEQITSLHRGKISVHSDGEGKGTSFTVEMPMTRNTANNSHDAIVPITAPSDSLSDLKVHGCEEYGDLPAGQTKLDGIPSLTVTTSALGFDMSLLGTVTPPSPSYEMLVADDSRLNRKMLLKCLRADGHTCIEGQDGSEAIALVKERINYANGGHGKPFDAILMDFIMLNMDGPTATREIRALGSRGPILGVTGNGESDRSSKSDQPPLPAAIETLAHPLPLLLLPIIRCLSYLVLSCLVSIDEPCRSSLRHQTLLTVRSRQDPVGAARHQRLLGGYE